MHQHEMKNHLEEQKLPSEESHLVTDPLGENRRNPAKNHENILSISNLNTIIMNIIFYKKWNKLNEIKLKNKKDLSNRKIKIAHPPSRVIHNYATEFYSINIFKIKAAPEWPLFHGGSKQTSLD